jgi:hypothetical protein
VLPWLHVNVLSVFEAPSPSPALPPQLLESPPKNGLAGGWRLAAHTRGVLLFAGGRTRTHAALLGEQLAGRAVSVSGMGICFYKASGTGSGQAGQAVKSKNGICEAKGPLVRASKPRPFFVPLGT